MLYSWYARLAAAYPPFSCRKTHCFIHTPNEICYSTCEGKEWTEKLHCDLTKHDKQHLIWYMCLRFWPISYIWLVPITWVERDRVITTLIIAATCSKNASQVCNIKWKVKWDMTPPRGGNCWEWNMMWLTWPSLYPTYVGQFLHLMKNTLTMCTSWCVRGRSTMGGEGSGRGAMKASIIRLIFFKFYK